MKSELTNTNKCVSKTQTRYTGSINQYCAPGQHFHHRLYASNCSTQGDEARPPNLTSASWDLELWPPDHRGWTLHGLASGTACANMHWNRFICFFL